MTWLGAPHRCSSLPRLRDDGEDYSSPREYPDGSRWRCDVCGLVHTLRWQRNVQYDTLPGRGFSKKSGPIGPRRVYWSSSWDFSTSEYEAAQAAYNAAQEERVKLAGLPKIASEVTTPRDAGSVTGKLHVVWTVDKHLHPGDTLELDISLA